MRYKVTLRGMIEPRLIDELKAYLSKFIIDSSDLGLSGEHYVPITYVFYTPRRQLDKEYIRSLFGEMPRMETEDTWVMNPGDSMFGHPVHFG